MKFVRQQDQMDCGLSCLLMVCSYYKIGINRHMLSKHIYPKRTGVSLRGISFAAQKVNIKSMAYKATVKCLKTPSILHWNDNHFVVLYKIEKVNKKYIYKIADPSFGKVAISETELSKHWLKEDGRGIFLHLVAVINNNVEPDHSNKNDRIVSAKKKMHYIKDKIRAYKYDFLKVILCLIMGSILTLFFPFLTQILFDQGVMMNSLDVISLILIAQFFMFVGSSFIEVYKNWIVLYMGVRINVQIVADYLFKLTRLPLKYFETKMLGDVTNKITDQKRIEYFLTSESLTFFFSIINFFVLLIVLSYYSGMLTFVYIAMTLLSIAWVFLFLKYRKKIDYENFSLRNQSQDSVFEFIIGMQDFKLFNYLRKKIKKWEEIQVLLFKNSQQRLKIDQLQNAIFDFINQFKNILITYLAARLVLKDSISIGVMISISYIIGQMNNPINQLVGFVRSFQDANFSLSRLLEVDNEATEESLVEHRDIDIDKYSDSSVIIDIKKLSFRYGAPYTPYVLRDISISFYKNKSTAIVGESGSGKSTLIKLLLKFYETQEGEIFYNNISYNYLRHETIRKECGVVMQDGFIFSDTIEKNIITADEVVDEEKLQNALYISNLADFINSLPLGLDTLLGSQGNGISGGQKQRILIARAVYKDPKILIMDEAINALDTMNEKLINDRLKRYSKNKTTITVAHRMSTVKEADQIIVLKKGNIVEVGKHQELVNLRGYYFSLIKNQLELES